MISTHSRSRAFRFAFGGQRSPVMCSFEALERRAQERPCETGFALALAPRREVVRGQGGAKPRSLCLAQMRQEAARRDLLVGTVQADDGHGCSFLPRCVPRHATCAGRHEAIVGASRTAGTEMQRPQRSLNTKRDPQSRNVLSLPRRRDHEGG
jgi:hypothetical protein